MTYQVLYRKYRPKDFSEVVGQDHIVSVIRRQVQTGRVAHAYLFSGPRGIGKTTTARLIAKSVNCVNAPNASHPESRFQRDEGSLAVLKIVARDVPCNTCPSCEVFNSGQALNLIEIDAASNRGIDEIRELREAVRFAPPSGGTKVYIIDECLTADHLVALADGRVRAIADVKDGDEILSADLSTGSITTSKVSNKFSRRTEQLIYLRTPQATIKCTPTHRLWIARGGMFQLVEARDILPSDFLLSPIVLPHAARNSFSSDQLVFLALIQCDGHVSKDNLTIQLEVSKDTEYFMESFKRGVKAWGLPGTLTVAKTKRGTTLLRFFSHALKDRLIGLGCPAGKKSFRIDIPDEVFQAPLESIRAYLDTCFCCEGDAVGNFGMHKLNFTTTSEVFAKKFQLLLKKFGIGSSIMAISRQKRNKNYRDAYRVSISGYDLSLFQQRIGISLKRKSDIISGQLNHKERQDGIPLQISFLQKRYESHIKHSFLNRHGIYLDRTQPLARQTVQEFIRVTDSPEFLPYLQFRYEKIINIEHKSVEEIVYDFTVAGTHTFVANGICSSNCHQLTKDAANALLKTLEEPPTHAIFVLATTEIDKVPQTIVSRTQHFDFRRPRRDILRDRLLSIAVKEGVKLAPDAAEAIAFASEGSVRDSESMLGKIMAVEDKTVTLKEVEEILGIPKREALAALFDFIGKKQLKEAVELVNRLYHDGYEMEYLTKMLISFFRDALLAKIDPTFNPVSSGSLLPDESRELAANLAAYSADALGDAITELIEALASSKRSPIPQLPLELALINIVHGSTNGKS